MRLSLALAALLPIALAACNTSVTAPKPGTPIDCSTLATSLSTANDLVVADSGLRYRDVVVGNGATVANGQTLSVHYAGCLTSGAQFDQNLDNQPALSFPVGNPGIISGFNKGVLGMKVGGTRQIVIPPALGYGDAGRAPIPGGATIVFTVIAVSVQ